WIRKLRNGIAWNNYKKMYGDFLNHVCSDIKEAEYLVIFDIDCVPIKKDWFNNVTEELHEPRTIIGAAQTANHLRNAQYLYV
ncbi:MAG: hypothetical protein ABI863_17510, partial [Ginsengibacter sp.]